MQIENKKMTVKKVGFLYFSLRGSVFWTNFTTPKLMFLEKKKRKKKKRK